ESFGLLGVVAGADAEHGAAAREHVERGNALGEQTSVAVGGRGCQRQQANALRARSDEADGGVGLDLAGLDAAGVLAAPYVVGDADGVEAASLGRFNCVCQSLAQPLGAAAPVRRGDVQAEL